MKISSFDRIDLVNSLRLIIFKITYVWKVKKSIFIVLVLFTMALGAQEKSFKDSEVVKSIDTIVKEVLNIVSGKKGKVRNWNAYRQLFLPTARFTILNQGDSISEPYRSLGLEEFISSFENSYRDKEFFEYETGKTVEEYNGLAQVFQSFHAKDSENLNVRGISSYQLIFYEDRWWIANMVWTVDSNGIRVPEKYLDNKN